MTTLYSTKVTAIGGRAGSVRSDDGLIDFSLALPTGMGGKGGATNPEQLFAAGYAACFENAILHVAQKQSAGIADNAITVVATVGIGPNSTGGFALSVALDVAFTGVELEKAKGLVATAHQVCPYSNAVRGNIDVAITVSSDA
tara:strand:- start:2024 stop:2452 length:429 start_codon:yes stop_codon:yes gene_type:complete